jgi:RNA polymerase sigma-70 factor (ECF subfamily)
VTNVEQFEEHRRLLFSLAYRTLGSWADAEDVVQDTFLRWQAAKDEEVRSPRSYLTTIAARLALDVLKSAQKKRETYAGPWLPEPIVEPPTDSVELAESLSMAFLHLLESLSAPERVAFLLHEVFDTGYDEIAAVLQTTEANARQIVSRARKHIQDRRPRFSVDRARHEQVLRQFLTTCSNGDVAGLRAVLEADVVFYSDGGGKTGAALLPIYGVEKVTRLMLHLPARTGADGGYHAELNGQPAFVLTRGGDPYSTLMLELGPDDRIRSIFAVVNPEKLRHLCRPPDPGSDR